MLDSHIFETNQASNCSTTDPLTSLLVSDRGGRNTWSTYSNNANKSANINCKNFHRSLTIVVRAQNDTSKLQISLIPFSIEKGDNFAAIDISAIYCYVLSLFSTENGISDICCFRGVILSPYNSMEVFSIYIIYLRQRRR